MIMAALVQHISYDEFLPVLLGKEQIAKFGLSIGQVKLLKFHPAVQFTKTCLRVIPTAINQA
jgi:hypothetical protein